MRRLALTLVTISSPFALASCAGLSSDTEPPLQPPVLCSTDTTTRDAMIHDALLSHPEWLMEMSQAMRQRQQAAQQQTAKQAIAQNHDTLFADPADPVAGNPAGAVTVVLFFDASCPYCKQVSPDIDRLMQENPDVRVIFKEFPILGPASQLAATAGLASLKQGKYDAFHRALMADKTPEHQLAEPHLMEIAKSVGLDGVRLKKDMSSPEIAQKLAANIELGHRLGITGTPGLIIGDRLTPGAMPYAAMVEAVATARASQSAENR